MTSRLVRAPVVRIYDHRDSTAIVGADGSGQLLSGESSTLVRTLCEHLLEPRTRPEIVAHLAALCGEPITPGGPRHAMVEQLLELLVSLGVVLEQGARSNDWPSSSVPPPRSLRRLLLGISGTVGALLTPALAVHLQQRGYDLRIAMTRDARRFLRPAALERLVHGTVYRSLWQRDAVCPVPHINLADWAEVVLIRPASATLVSRMASGDCSDSVSAIALATRAPVIVAPSITGSMLSAPSVVRNLDRLRQDGFHLVHSVTGTEVPHHGPAELAAILDFILEQTALAPGAE